MAKQNTHSFKQTSFCDVNTSNVSSGLRENIILTYLVPKYGRKIWCSYGCRRRGGTPGRTIFTKVMCMCPYWWVWSMWDYDWDVKKGGINVDRGISWTLTLSSFLADYNSTIGPNAPQWDSPFLSTT